MTGGGGGSVRTIPLDGGGGGECRDDSNGGGSSVRTIPLDEGKGGGGVSGVGTTPPGRGVRGVVEEGGDALSHERRGQGKARW